MKTTSLLLTSVVLIAALYAEAEAPSSVTDDERGNDPHSSEATYRIIERGAHHRTWERTVYQDTPFGAKGKVQRFLELATGMHWQEKEDGPWLETEEEIEPFPGGAIARKGPHKVFFNNDLAVAGAIDLRASDGQRIRSHPLMLSYFDPTTGQSVLVGEVKSCQGKVVGRNQVVYEDAFTDIKASVRYTYTKAGLEQDIILLEGLPAPEAWGMSSDCVVVEALTEFLDNVVPEKSPRGVQYAKGQVLRDETLGFGSMRIGVGKAFSLGETARLPAIRVSKEFLKMDTRDFLLERIPYRDIKPHLRALPAAKEASATPSSKRANRVALRKDLLPAARVASKQGARNMELASVVPFERGLVLDYISLSTSGTNYVFGPYYTYLISGVVNLAGTTVFEGGAVIKYPVSGSATILSSNVVFQGSLHAPVMFTAAVDSTLGENMGTVNPITSYYGRVALDLSSAPNPQTVSNARFCYLSNALAGIDLTVLNSEFVRCRTGFAAGSLGIWLRNVLVWDVNTLCASEDYIGDCFRGENLTVHNCANLMEDPLGTVCLTNCLLVCVTNWQGMATYTNACAFLDDSTGVFQTVGGGSHYLAENSPYRNAGSTNIDPSVLATLKSRTTFPPVVYSNVTIATVSTFGPQAPRDTDTPDLGWHYSPLDYVFGGVTAATNLTFLPGTVAGWFRTTSGWQHAGHGIHANDRTSISFSGTVDNPTCWLRANLAQENCNGIWQGGYGPGGITGWAWPSFADAPKVLARFTRFPCGSSEAMPMRDDWGYLDVQATHCEFSGGSLGGYISRIALTNCLMDTISTWVSQEASVSENAHCALVVRNCLFRNGNFDLSRYNSGGQCEYCGTSCYNTTDCGNNCCLNLCQCSECGHTCCECAPGGCSCDYCSYMHSGTCDCGSAPVSAFALWSIRDCALENMRFLGSDSAGGSVNCTDYDYNAFRIGDSRTLPQGSNDVLVAGGFGWQTSWFGRYYLPTNSVLLNVGSTTNAGLAGLYHFTTQTNQTRDGASPLDIGLHYVAAGVDGIPTDADGDTVPDYLEDVNGNGNANDDPTSWQSYNSPGGLSSSAKLRIYTPLR